MPSNVTKASLCCSLFVTLSLLSAIVFSDSAARANENLPANTTNHDSNISSVSSGIDTGTTFTSPSAASREAFNALADRIFGPNNQVFDAACNLYIGEATVIRKVMPDGNSTILAGQPNMSGTVDGTGSEARLRLGFSNAITIDGWGNLYFADTNTIRRVTPAGVVNTIAGSVGMFGSVDGAGSAARFESPFDLTADTAGNIYVADPDTDQIRKVTPGGVVTTIAGSGNNGTIVNGPLATAKFIGPIRIAIDAGGTIYIEDVTFPPSNFSPTNQAFIRMITPDNVVTTIASDRDSPQVLKKIFKKDTPIAVDQLYCQSKKINRYLSKQYSDE